MGPSVSSWDSAKDPQETPFWHSMIIPYLRIMSQMPRCHLKCNRDIWRLVGFLSLKEAQL